MIKNKPAHEVRLGSIKAAIWENPVGDGIKFNIKFSRLYKEGEEWKASDSFGRDDLLLVAKVADQAHTWIHEQRSIRDRDASMPDRSSEGASASATQSRRTTVPGRPDGRA